MGLVKVWHCTILRGAHFFVLLLLVIKLALDHLLWICN